MPYNERIPLTGVTLSEALGGTLPSVDVLSRSFQDAVQDAKGPQTPLHNAKGVRQRVLRLTAMTEAWRAKAERYRLPDGGLENPKRDTLALLFLDSIDYVAWASIDGKKLRNRRDNGVDNSEIYQNKLLSHAALRQRVEEFDQVFADAPAQLKYAALDALIFDAYCLVNDTTNHGPQWTVRQPLAGMLAEYKVYKALKQAELPVRYGSIYEDGTLGWDMTVSVKDDHSVCKALQIKSSSHEEVSRIKAETERDGKLRITVPMHDDLDQFNLPAEDVRALAAAVTAATPVALPNMLAKLRHLV